MIAQYVFFPKILLSIINSAVSKASFDESCDFVPEGIEILTWKTALPAVFSVPSLFAPRFVIITEGLSSNLDSKFLSYVLKREYFKARSLGSFILMSVSCLPFVIRHISILITKLGARNKFYGGAGSVLSFGRGLSLFASALYLPLYIVSKIMDAQAEASVRDEAGLKAVLDVHKELFSKPHDMESEIFLDSIDFLCFASKKDFEMLNEGCLDSLWRSWFLLFRPHMPYFARIHGLKQSLDRQDLKEYVLAIFIAVSAFCIFIFASFGVNFGILMIGFAICLFALHFLQRPFFSKKQPILEILPVSPIKGYQIAARGKILLIGPNEYIFEFGAAKLPLYFYELTFVELEEQESEAYVEGWLKKGDRTYLELMTIKINGKKIYSSPHPFFYLVADAVVLIIGILMTAAHFSA